MRGLRNQQLERTAIACLAVLCCSKSTALGAAAQLLFKLTAPEPQAGARFGETLAGVEGDIVVGEPLRWVEDIALAGQVYMFDGQSGQLKTTFANPAPKSEDTFGEALAGGDEWVFIAASGGLREENRVYVYDKTSGAVIHQIKSPAIDSEGFGSAIAYGHGVLAISSPSFSVPGLAFPVGRAHLFDVETGGLLRTLPNPEPNSADVFGNAASVFGNKVAVGAILDDLPDDITPGGDDPGRVWVFDRQTGSVAFTLENPNAQSGFLDWFGAPIAANDDFIVVGAQEDGTSGSPGSGTVYIFDANTGELQHTLFSQGDCTINHLPNRISSR